MFKEATLLIGAAALICAAGCQKNDPPKPAARTLEDTGDKVLKTREDVKALFPDAAWLEAKQGEASFMFCANDLPAYGSSKIEVHGWVFRRHSEQWEKVFTVRLNGVGGVKLSVDPKTGVFSATGSANNKFKDKPVFTFDLLATVM